MAKVFKKSEKLRRKIIVNQQLIYQLISTCGGMDIY